MEIHKLVDATKGKEITFQEIRNESVKLALWMKMLGVHPGDEILISSNHYAVMYVFFASLFIGATPTLWHEKHTFATINRIMFDAERKIMFIDDILATAFFDDLLGIKSTVVVFGTFTTFVPYDDLKSQIDTIYNQEVIDEFICAQLDKNKKNIATILYTRGVCNFSKPVDIPHATFTAAVNKQVFDMLPAGVGMWVGSFSSLTNLILVVCSILWFKRTIRFMGYRKEEICQTLEKHKVNWVLLETYMCREIVNSNLLNKHDLSSLKMLLFSGSPISYDDRYNLIKSLPITSIISLYATTETGIISCQGENGKMTSCGYVGKNVCVRIINTIFNKKCIADPYLTGEICCKHRNIAHVYHNYDNMPSDLTDIDGWYYTGDLGYFDKDGEIYVLERISDLILFQQVIFSPTILENVISRNSAIETVVVVPVIDNDDFEHPIAFISTKPKQKLNIREVIEEVNDKLHECMRLRGGVKLLLEMPISLSGNIDRFLLREQANEEKYAQIRDPLRVYNIYQIQQY
ncbi:4-coumarate--CoA ligase-like 7 isoform X3 [Odontomachus brunneus]|uniref:4-coumarate--CoA ligase-like 7 isoform X3 n=1 Tax=Odontomachus brunneus TaxID=486640 RepID=UPI0013F2A74B|nr:4-coumarate--CoA ligase-like 7 isoform X3 [Odontomachus brunneus]XP_032676380.1 4-coumarate--CoA ligase-like 7 isoform X3 [Odontomachus brunneus]